MDPTAYLRHIETAEQVVVLFAAESGSRAWGFPSPDSDWDVRFIYARPTLWHVQIEAGRDVIEKQYPGDLDVSGWDMRKTMGLILRGNCAVREWLSSPIVYHSETELVLELVELVDLVPARRAARHHYLALIRRVSGQWLQRSPVNLKKYLYAVRPALALRWLRAHPVGTPPMDIGRLQHEVTMTATEQLELSELLALKAQASEVGMGAPRVAIDAMIATEVMLAAEAAATEPQEAVSADLIRVVNDLLIKASAFADERLRHLV